jgi:hypothetical protein
MSQLGTCSEETKPERYGGVQLAIRRWQGYSGETARHAVDGHSFAELAEERGGRA